MPIFSNILRHSTWSRVLQGATGTSVCTSSIQHTWSLQHTWKTPYLHGAQTSRFFSNILRNSTCSRECFCDVPRQFYNPINSFSKLGLSRGPQPYHRQEIKPGVKPVLISRKSKYRTVVATWSFHLYFQINTMPVLK